MFHLPIFFRISTIIVLIAATNDAMRVLIYPAPGSASHVRSMYPIAEQLAAYGHHAVMVQLLKEGSEKPAAPNGSNVEDRYLIVPKKPSLEGVGKQFHHSADFLWKKRYFAAFNILIPWRTTTVLCKDALENEAVRRQFYAMIRDEKWDLVIVDDIFAICGMLAAAELKTSSNAAVIGFGTTILMPRSLAARGVHINFALYPSLMRQSPSFDHRTFSGRFVNVMDFYSFHLVQALLDYFVPYWMGLPASESTMPSIFSSGKVSDMLLSSVSPILEFVKPMSNDMVALDTKCPSPPAATNTSSSALPGKYQDFIEDPKSNGTILFAMGHGVHWDGAPEQVTRSFLVAFANLTQYRIIWQFATQHDQTPGIEATPNVLLDKWIPQAAILNHPKTKLFISHFGMKSVRETICAGVPALAMPMFAEQAMNAAVGFRKGMSLFLDKTDLSPAIVYDQIIEILYNDSYSRNVKALKYQLEDRIIQPMELGRFWSEFLVRHKDGGSSIRKYFHMRQATEQMWHEKGNLDINIIGVVIFVTVLTTIAT